MNFYMNMLWIFYGKISVYETLTFHIYQNMKFIWILYEICITLTTHFMHKKPSSADRSAKTAKLFHLKRYTVFMCNTKVEML